MTASGWNVRRDVATAAGPAHTVPRADQRQRDPESPSARTALGWGRIRPGWQPGHRTWSTRAAVVMALVQASADVADDAQLGEGVAVPDVADAAATQSVVRIGFSSRRGRTHGAGRGHPMIYRHTKRLLDLVFAVVALVL